MLGGAELDAAVAHVVLLARVSAGGVAVTRCEVTGAGTEEAFGADLAAVGALAATLRGAAGTNDSSTVHGSTHDGGHEGGNAMIILGFGSCDVSYHPFRT